MNSRGERRETRLGREARGEEERDETERHEARDERNKNERKERWENGRRHTAGISCPHIYIYMICVC